MARKTGDKTLLKKDIGTSFTATLLLDVVDALDYLNTANTGSARRSALRTIISAIEGLCWIYREHIRSIATEMNMMDPLLELAMKEQSYVVNKQGDINIFPRYVSVTAMIKLTTTLAEKISDDLKINFNAAGWSNLKVAIVKRNAVTHPKTKSDLEVSQRNIEIATSGFFWLLNVIEQVMSATNSKFSNMVVELDIIRQELNAGNKDTWDLYNQLAKEI